MGECRAGRITPASAKEQGREGQCPTILQLENIINSCSPVTTPLYTVNLCTEVYIGKLQYRHTCRLLDWLLCSLIQDRHRNTKRAEKVNGGDWWRGEGRGSANGLKRQSCPVTHSVHVMWWLPWGGSVSNCQRERKMERADRRLGEGDWKRSNRKIEWILKFTIVTGPLWTHL